jgi:AraC-like DNA-binding protein
MTGELFFNGDSLRFMPGYPPNYAGPVLPSAVARYASGPWGIVCLQEIKAENYLLRHFLFAVKQILFLRTIEKDEGVQSIICLKGELDYSVKGLPTVAIQEKEFHLLNAHEGPAVIGLKWGKTCSVLNTYYQPQLYEDLLGSFPLFKKQLKKAAQKAFHFCTPTVARHSIHDSIQAIFLDDYAANIERKYIEKRIETSLFTQLAQTYSPRIHERPSTAEKEKADAARAMILQNLRKHIPVEDIARELNCSPSWLQKAFSKIHNMGMRHFLREQRMYAAKERLLQGESLKSVAIDVGMKPRYFPEEFKSFFGYSVTELKKGMRR